MSSPWNITEPVATLSFGQIMSEDLDHKKCVELQARYGLPELSVANDSPPVALPDDILAELELIDAVCESDSVIARTLQTQFDKEHDEVLRRVERNQNKNAKVSVSLRNYRLASDEGQESDSDVDDDPQENNSKDWDTFDAMERKFGAIPKCGYKMTDDGEMVTKHDPGIASVRNACRVMSFPPDFPTGDGNDMRLSNAVFNQLKSYSHRGAVKKHRMHDRRENAATAEMGLDGPTRLLLYKMVNNEVFDHINGIVSTGKESIILHADISASYAADQLVPPECAIKVFKTTLNEFKQRDRYIKDDYRFRDRFSKQNARTVITMWAEKEMHNLMRMQKAGIRCPDVVLLRRHVLVMSFIGQDGKAAPKLKDAALSPAELIVAHEELVEMLKRLYADARLVHADLSEYNVLWHKSHCWLIDVAQSVAPDHPSALEFLMRDCNNLTNFFTRQGVPNVLTKEELFAEITDLDPVTHNAAMLERIHMKGAPAHIANRPDTDTDTACGAHNRLDAFPFDYAWENAQEKRTDGDVVD